MSAKGKKRDLFAWGGVRGKRIRDRGSESERGGTETALVLSTGVFPGVGIVVRGRYSGGSRFVTGSLYARECYYFAPEGYYSGILYNVVLPGNPGMAYPLWMRGPYERREVKWLD